MKSVCLLHVSIIVCLIAMPVFSSEVGRIGPVVDVGNEPGYSAFASGKTIAAIHQGNCNYSMTLLENQHVKFNSPDVVFLESKIISRDQNWPYLAQAEMSAGYDWHFEENSHFKYKWFGLMCEGVENFGSLRSDKNISSDEDSSELQFIKEANDLACPATMTDKGWVPNNNAGQAQEYVFHELAGVNWSGFIVGFKGKAKDSFKRINFCMVHEGNVLMGAAVNAIEPLWLNQRSFEEIQVTLTKVQFLP